MTEQRPAAFPALAWCPFADEESAAKAAEALLEEGLIACANILPPMRSLYRWDGERGEGRETGMLLKTNEAQLPALLERLTAIHPYDEPAILAWPCDAAPQTAAWLGELGA